MNLLRLVPSLSLGIVLGALLISTCSDPPVDFPYTEPPEGAPPPPVELPMGDVTFHGRVVDLEGQPIDGAGVSLDQRGRPFYAWTDADGRFTLSELWPEGVRVRVIALGFMATALDGTDLTGTSADAPRELVLTRRISEPPRPAEMRLADLEGLVRLPAGASAAPEDSYELLLVPTTAPTEPGGGFPRRAPVAPGGEFKIDLLHEGTYRAVLLAPEDRGGRGPDLLAGPDGAPRIVEHTAGNELGGMELVATAGRVRGLVSGPASTDDLEAAPPAVRGALLRAERIVGETSDGRPRVDRSNFRAARSDEDGRFELTDLAPGPHLVTMVAGRRREERRVEISERGEVVLRFEAEEVPR
ncbi:MAG: carboxypeptidase-like regulatory domain-containing protein [Planctomycetota bacterium]|nr:carboxypeptidase-like regulatory domain-containing protein [Planctomycetota bacterium]